MGRFVLMFLISMFGFLHTKNTLERLRTAVFDVGVLKNLLTSVYFFFFCLFLSYYFTLITIT